MSTQQRRFAAVPKKWKVGKGQILAREGADYFDNEEDAREHVEAAQAQEWEMWEIDAEDRLIARYPEEDGPEFIPSAGTLDHFRALIEIARQLAEAASIPASLRAKCASVCENAEQAIKREALFMQAAGRLNRASTQSILALAMIRRVSEKCPIKLNPENAYHAVNLTTGEIEEIRRIVDNRPTGSRPLLGPAFAPEAELPNMPEA